MKWKLIKLITTYYKAKRWIQESKWLKRLTDDRSGRGIGMNENGKPEWLSRTFFDVEDAARYSSTAGKQKGTNA